MKNAHAYARAAALAAFALTALPALAQQPPTAPAFAPPDLSERGVRMLAANCYACHGTDGKGSGKGADLELAGLQRDRIVQRMTQFKQDQRPATVMHQLARGFTDAEIEALADFFSRMR